MVFVVSSDTNKIGVSCIMQLAGELKIRITIACLLACLVMGWMWNGRKKREDFCHQQKSEPENLR